MYTRRTARCTERRRERSRAEVKSARREVSRASEGLVAIVVLLVGATGWRMESRRRRIRVARVSIRVDVSS